mmetsp:Transcript_10851/g.18163  ORF Transcript_10851/g.18163 Transcript_10851/m.18163 type:complete len:278 (+) Transcript_10851:837-1670(+)
MVDQLRLRDHLPDHDDAQVLHRVHPRRIPGAGARPEQNSHALLEERLHVRLRVRDPPTVAEPQWLRAAVLYHQDPPPLHRLQALQRGPDHAEDPALLQELHAEQDQEEPAARRGHKLGQQQHHAADQDFQLAQDPPPRLYHPQHQLLPRLLLVHILRPHQPVLQCVGSDTRGHREERPAARDLLQPVRAGQQRGPDQRRHRGLLRVYLALHGRLRRLPPQEQHRAHRLLLHPPLRSRHLLLHDGHLHHHPRPVSEPQRRPRRRRQAVQVLRAAAQLQ